MIRRSSIPILLALAVLAAGCESDSSPAAAPEPTQPSSSSQLGEGVAFLLEGARARLLCQVLDDAEWNQLLGEPVVERKQDDGECQISSAKHSFVLELSDDQNEAMTSHDPIAGRPAMEYNMGSLGTSLEVTLFDDLSARGYRMSQLTPYLKITGAADKDIEPRVEPVAQALVQKLTRPGPQLPPQGEFVPTPPTPGVPLFDLTVPVIARQLCTVALDAAEQTTQTVHLSFGGSSPSCGFVQPHPGQEIVKDDDGFWNFNVSLTDIGADKPTGRAGELQPTVKNPGNYVTCLTDECEYFLEISGEDTGSPVTLREFAERVVTRVLGQ